MNNIDNNNNGACYFVSNDAGDYSVGYMDGRTKKELAARVPHATTVLVNLTRHEAEELKNS